MSGIIKIDNWDEIFLGKGLYELTPEERFMVMDGSAVLNDLLFRFPYRITKIEWKHTDNANPPVDVIGTVAFVFSHSTLAGSFSIILENSIVDPDGIFLAGERYEYSANILRLSFNTTSTNRIWPIVTIQVLGRR